MNFHELAERYEVSGGDVRNAVLKAALSAAAEPGPDEHKRIHHTHFVRAMEEVIAGKRVMAQSILRPSAPHHSVEEAMAGMAEVAPALGQMRSMVLMAAGLAALALVAALAALILAIR